LQEVRGGRAADAKMKAGFPELTLAPGSRLDSREVPYRVDLHFSVRPVR